MRFLSQEMTLLAEMATNQKREERWNALLCLALQNRRAQTAALSHLCEIKLPQKADVEFIASPSADKSPGQADMRLFAHGYVDLLIECKLDASLGENQPKGYIGALKEWGAAPAKRRVFLVPGGRTSHFHRSISNRLKKPLPAGASKWRVGEVIISISTWEDLAAAIHRGAPDDCAAAALHSITRGLCSSYNYSPVQSAYLRGARYLAQRQKAERVLKFLASRWGVKVTPGTFDGNPFPFVRSKSASNLRAFVLDRAAVIWGFVFPLHVQVENAGTVDRSWGEAQQWDWRSGQELKCEWGSPYRWSGFVAPLRVSEKETPEQAVERLGGALDDLVRRLD